ncbi:hypothetical protein BDZ89DRAFT_1151239 [Hymenopellis radicata]|nr:hypothetical protein BDZ89DRAFT_1151239 [Hymenopellis radicata]
MTITKIAARHEWPRKRPPHVPNGGVLRLAIGNESGIQAAPTVVVVNALIAELINIWRCWEVYHRNWIVIVAPLLGILCGLISHAFVMVAWFRPTGITVNVNILQVNWKIVYYSVTASISILTTTVLIIARIVSQTGGLKRARTYRGVIEILVESALLYSSYTVTLHCSCGMSRFPTVMSVSTNETSDIIQAAPTLIIECVMALLDLCIPAAYVYFL